MNLLRNKQSEWHEELRLHEVQIGRRQLLKAGGGLASLALLGPLAACAREETPEGGPFQGGSFSTQALPSVSAAPWAIAAAKGFWIDQDVEPNLEYNLLPSHERLQLQVGGNIDIGQSDGWGAFNNLMRQDAPLKVVGGFMRRTPEYDYSWILVSEEVWNDGGREIAALKDKGYKLGVTWGWNNSGGILTLQLFRDNDMNLLGPEPGIEAVPIRDLGALAQAGIAGELDAMIHLEPFATLLEKDHGWHRIIGASEARTGTELHVVVNEDWAQANRELVVRSLRGLVQGMRYYKEGRDSDWATNSDVPDILSELTGLDRDLITQIHPVDFSDDLAIDLDTIDWLLTVYVGLGDTPEATDVSTWVDDSYAREALEGLS